MTDKPTKFEQTHISIVLDRSGSMEDCAREALGSVNAYLAEARKDAVLKEADLKLTIFDSVSIDDIRSGAPVALADITGNDYQPRGGTPLYDAIGRGIDSLDARTAASGSSKAILVVMTDGLENASHKYRGEEGRRLIQAMIKERQGKGWMVMFLGAGIEAARQGAMVGAAAALTANIGKDAKSMRAVAESLSASTSEYASAPSARHYMASGKAQFSAKARTEMGDASGGAGIVPPADPTAKPPDSAGLANDPNGIYAGLRPAMTPADDAWDRQNDDAWSA